MAKQSLARRQSQHLGLISLIPLLIVAILALWLAERVTLKTAAGTYLSLAERSALQLASEMTTVDSSARLVQVESLAPENDATSERKLVRDILESNRLLAGMAVIRAPIGAERVVSPFWFRNSRGELDYQDLGGQSSANLQPWFLQALQCAGGCWSGRFHSARRNADLLQYSLGLPPRPDGSVPGIVSADVPVDWLQQRLRGMSKDGVVAYMFDRTNARILFHPDAADDGLTIPDLMATTGRHASPAAEALLLGDRPGAAKAYSKLRRARVRYYLHPIPQSDWNLVLSVPESALLAAERRLEWLVGGLLLLSLVLRSVLSHYYLLRSLKPLEHFQAAAQRIANGNLLVELPPLRRNDEIGQLADSFEHMRRQLQQRIHESQEYAAQRERRQSELQIALQIQKSLMPDTESIESVPQVEAHGFLLPLRGVGGDFYHFLKMPGDRVSFILGDVSDKGIAAALFMSQAVTLYRASAPHLDDPALLLSRLNQELSSNNTAFMFATAVCGILELETGKLMLASAGHEPPLLCSAGPAQLLELENGPALGVEAGNDYRTRTLQLEPGQTIVLYTDGITEACSPSGELLGTKRLIDAMHGTGSLSPLKCIESLRHSVFLYMHEAQQTDDIALLALRWLPAGHVRATSLASTREAAFDALDWCEASAGELGASYEQSLMVRLAAEELLINLVSHGYGTGRPGVIDVLLLRQPSGITLRIIDDALPFDPSNAATPSASRSDEVRAGGGEGLNLVRSLSAAMRYHRRAKGNLVEVDFPSPAVTSNGGGNDGA